MELGIVVWILSACACAFWLSVKACNKGMPEFRWFLAGLVGSVFALPFFSLAVSRKTSGDTEETAIGQRFDDLSVTDGPADDAGPKEALPAMKQAA